MLGSNPRQLRLRHWLSDALTTRLDFIHSRLDLIHNSARSHPVNMVALRKHISRAQIFSVNGPESDNMRFKKKSKKRRNSGFPSTCVLSRNKWEFELCVSLYICVISRRKIGILTLDFRLYVLFLGGSRLVGGWENRFVWAEEITINLFNKNISLFS
jgi:hypothetical protein